MTCLRIVIFVLLVMKHWVTRLDKLMDLQTVLVKFSKKNQKIFFNCFKISPLLGPVAFAGSAVVPSQGWFIFGGSLNQLNTSQKLQSLDGIWEVGPGKNISY